MTDALVAEVVPMRQMVQHTGHDTARAAGGSSDDGSASSILLAYGQGIGEHQATALQRGSETLGLYIIVRSLAGQMQRAGQHALMLKAILHRLLHGLPYRLKEIPYLRSLTFLNILPIAPSVVKTPLHNLLQRVHAVHLWGSQYTVLFSFGQGTASNTEHRPLVCHGSIIAKGSERHSVGMVFQRGFRLPHYRSGSQRCQHLLNSLVGKVSLACCGKAAIKGDFKAGRATIASGKYRCRFVRSHRMAARWALANPV